MTRSVPLVVAGASFALCVFLAAPGLTWLDGAGRRHSLEDWKLWTAKRAQAGKMAPRGFPRSLRFAPRGSEFLASQAKAE